MNYTVHHVMLPHRFVYVHFSTGSVTPLCSILLVLPSNLTMASAPHPDSCHLTELLKNNEELVSALVSTDLVTFSKELFKSGVIAKEAKDQFYSLDHDHLDPGLRARYLLQHIRERVSDDVGVWQKFLGVLGRFGGKDLVSALLSEALNKADTGKTNEPLVTSGNNIHLQECHVTILSKILVGASHRWEEIGIALGLPMHVLEECGNGKSNAVRLHKVLCEWIAGNHGTVPVTLQSLKLELAGEVVRLHAISESLEAKFMESRRQLELPVSSMPQSGDALEIVYQSDDTEVADGKSTLLEVQVSASQSVAYQWMKDGKPLTDDASYLGTCSNILIIKHAGKGVEGKYMCSVRMGDQLKESEHINLIVNFSPAKQKLINIYLKERDVPPDSWPLVGIDTYINLAIIDLEHSEQSNPNHYTVRGIADDIIAEKVIVDYEKLFREHETGALFLVEGRPGSGKTTLVHKISRDWAKGNVLKKTNILFRIILRIFNQSESNTKLSDILEQYVHNNKLEEVVSDIEKRDGEGVCFILDGLDEYKPQDKDKSVVHRLIYKKYLPLSMVIVSSRPLATAIIRKKAPVTKLIEVVGFTKEQIFEYIDKYPFANDQPNSGDQLKKYLESYSTVFNMCYLPVNTAIICFIYSKEGRIPDRETHIFKKFTQLVILRHLTRRNETARLVSLEELSGKERAYFYDLCQLAFKMTLDQRQILYQHEISFPGFNHECNDDDVSLGLVTRDLVTELAGLEQTYSFVHLTFQEFLTAFHIVQLEVEKQMDIISEYGKVGNMVNVWKFYFGMINFEDKEEQLDRLMLWSDFGLMVEYSYESKQPKVCDRLCQSPGIFKLSFESHLHHAILNAKALSYIISNTTTTITAIHVSSDLVFLFFSSYKLLQEIFDDIEGNRRDCIHSFTLEYNNRYTKSKYADGNRDAAVLLRGLIQCKYLLKLSTSGILFHPDDIVTISKHFNLLQSLHISMASIYSDIVRCLVSQEKLCSNLRDLRLSRTKIDAEGASILATAAHCFKKIIILDLSNNPISSVGVATLVMEFLNSVTLTHLNLSRVLHSFSGTCSDLEDSTFIPLLARLQHNTTLRELKLPLKVAQSNGISLHSKLNNRTHSFDSSGMNLVILLNDVA